MFTVERSVYAVPGFTCAVFRSDYDGEKTLVGWFCDLEEAREIVALLNEVAFVSPTDTSRHAA